MARFAEVIADPQTMGVIAQRIVDGETLREICKAWKVPHGKMFEWISEDRGRAEQYLNALRICSETDVHEVVPLADAAKPEDVGVRKLQIYARLQRAEKFDRGRFGPVAAAVNVQVNNQVLPDRDTMLLETARAYALVLEDGAAIADRLAAPAQPLAPPEKEKPSERTQPEPDLI
jgi:terminase small subunit-like protein